MVQWITDLLERLGYVGIALLMFLENLFPPIPSELIMPFAGFAASRGDLNFIGVLLAGTLGSLVGALPWYFVGYKIGCKRLASWADKHGRWLTLSGDEVKKANAWFEKHCGKAVFFGRLVPAVRTLISVPAGIAAMSWTRFIMYSLLGSMLWNSVLAGLGYQLGENYSKVAQYMDPVTKGIVGLIIAAYVYRVIRFKGSKPRSTPSELAR
jgi:membrane protein DedA with SNARE-associated domain